MRWIAFPEQLALSLRRAWRSLTRRPGYFAIAVSSLAVALGLATTVIAHIDSLIHPDFATPYDNRLYVASAAADGKKRLEPEDIVQVLRAVPAFERVEGMLLTDYFPVEIGSAGSEQQIWRTSAAFFEITGATPFRGRWFRPNETGVALVTEDAWRNSLGSTEALDSARVIVNGLRYTVVGVIPQNLPPFISIPGGGFGRHSNDVVLPPASDSASNGAFTFATALVRSKRPMGRQAVNDAVAPLANEMVKRFGIQARPWRVRAIPFNAYRLVPIGGYETAMFLAAAIIVVIACANVSALMLARATARRRDQALRLALGASRRHLVADIAAEVLVIAAAGGVAAIVIGDWSMRILAAVTPPDLPWLGFRAPHWNIWVFGALFFVVIACVGLASLIPMFFVSGIAPVEQLKDNSGTTTGRPSRTFQVLVVGELALSLILFFGSTLVAKSADKVASFDFGYEARGVLQISPQVNVVETPRNVDRRDKQGRVRQSVREIGLDVPDVIAERLRRLPGVRDASWVNAIYEARGVMVSDESNATDRQLLNASRFTVGSGFLRTLGIPIVDGRDFTAGDAEGNGAVILDELAARRLFAGGRAVGKLVKLGRARGDDPWLPVVGVTRAAKHVIPEDPDVEIRPAVYLSRAQSAGYGPDFVLRAERGSGDIRPAAAAVVSDLLPPNTQFSTTKWVARYEQMLVTRRFIAGMFLTLSIASLVLAAAGAYGVLSYAVSQRMREFAVRVALGARRTHVVHLVVRDGLVMALGGTAIGGTVAMYAAFALWKWLWGVYPVDAGALLISEGALLGVTMLGAILPAMRATRANPVDVMRAT